MQKELTKSEVELIIAEFDDSSGALLPILHRIQDTVGYIPKHVVEWIAEAQNISRAEVHGVITFYHHFHEHPGAKHRVEVCQAEACQARGCRSLEAFAKQHLNCEFHQKTNDGNISLDPVYCLGLCATGPAIAIDGKPYSRINEDKFKKLIGDLS